MDIKITSSIVLYNNNIEMLQNAIDSLLRTNILYKLFLVDNSLSDNLRFLKNKDSRIFYIHNPSNPGFGAAHNIAIKKSIEVDSKYHFIVNPDIYFEGDVITPLVNYMKQNNDVGMVMPQILNLDSTMQNLPKLLPSPLGLLLRKLKRPNWYYNKFINKYELRFVNKEQIYNAPIISGCFTLINIKAIKEIGMYDDTYFMYFEDWDLSRRMHNKYKTIYFPKVSVYHEYNSGANSTFKLFRIFISSAITYFNKWGWIFDNSRKKINHNTLSQFK